VGVLLRGENWPVEFPLFLIVAAAMLYRAGASRVRAEQRWRAAAFYGGLVALALAIDSPIDAYADRLFWVHMVQHVLLTMVAPPLLLLGRPWPRLIRPLGLRARRPLARTVLAGSALAPVRRAVEWLSSPLQALAIFSAVLLAWHLPFLYDLTLRNGLVHDLEHALFFTTALAYWGHLTPASARRRLSDGQRVAYGTAGLLVGWVLAVVLGLAPSPVYDAYASLAHRPLGLSALADQQIAAGVMWVPASIPYTIAIFAAAYAWLDPARSSRRRRLVAADDIRPRET
jgi:putative membrane protein